MLKRFIEDETGATLIEYGLIASMFSVAMIAAFSALGDEYAGIYASIEAAVVGANASAP